MLIYIMYNGVGCELYSYLAHYSTSSATIMVSRETIKLGQTSHPSAIRHFRNALEGIVVDHLTILLWIDKTMLATRTLSISFLDLTLILSDS